MPGAYGVYQDLSNRGSCFSFPGELEIDVGLNTAGPDSNGEHSLRSGALDLLLATAVLMTPRLSSKRRY
jgi:hypothetical protein